MWLRATPVVPGVGVAVVVLAVRVERFVRFRGVRKYHDVLQKCHDSFLNDVFG
jgi:hypothetical protein